MIIDENTVFSVIDTETTGLDPVKDRVIEVAYVECTMFGIGNHASALFDPKITIPPAASAVHHLTDDDVRGMPEYGVGGFGRIIKTSTDAAVMVAHNAAFDGPFLQLTEPMICTMRLAQKLWHDLECGYGNQVLRYHFKLKPPVEPGAAMHRALPDALVTATLLIHELNELFSRSKDPASITVEGLISWIAEPMLLTTCRFGKHKGSNWSEIPRDYLQWIVRNMADADVDTLHTAKYYIENR